MKFYGLTVYLGLGVNIYGRVWGDCVKIISVWNIIGDMFVIFATSRYTISENRAWNDINLHKRTVSAKSNKKPFKQTCDEE